MNPRQALLDSLLAERYAPHPQHRRPPTDVRATWTEFEQCQHRRDLIQALDGADHPDVLDDDGEIDSIAVDLFVGGGNPTLTPTERRAAARRLLNDGHTKKWTAHRLGVSSTTLNRWLAEVA